MPCGYPAALLQRLQSAPHCPRTICLPTRGSKAAGALLWQLAATLSLSLSQRSNNASGGRHALCHWRIRVSIIHYVARNAPCHRLPVEVPRLPKQPAVIGGGAASRQALCNGGSCGADEQHSCSTADETRRLVHWSTAAGSQWTDKQSQQDRAAQHQYAVRLSAGA